MVNSRPYPRLEAFERLHISDGLSINAERWLHAHRYHRLRQNFQYQALYEPGIVYGLGVAPVPAQADGRLLQIQPGVAIDIEGNPIIVRQPEEFRIESEATTGQTLLVYLVVNYVDPDQLRRNTAVKVVQETFRIVEKLHLDPEDVELCRIQLLPGATHIQIPVDVFHPAANQLDFRGRCYPKPYPQLQVSVGQVVDDHTINNSTFNNSTFTGLTDLLRSVESLYPSLQTLPTVQSFSTKTLARELTIDCQLLQIPYRVLLAFTNLTLQRLHSYLSLGGVLLVVIDFDEANLLDLLNIARELELSLLEAERDQDSLAMATQLKTELEAIQTAINQRLAEIEQSLAPIATKLGLSLTESGELGEDHPLRWQPFTFSQFPHRNGHPIHVKNWGGLVLTIGDLSHCWGRNASPALPREVLRSAQEWGINLLHFAAQRWQWMQAMQPLTTPTNPPTDSLHRRIQT